MKSVTIVAVHYNEDIHHFEAVKEIEEDDGTTSFNLHRFSHDILEQRAAEYDLGAVEDAADLVLWEPFMDDFDVQRATPEAVQARRSSHLADRKQELKKTKDAQGVKTRMARAGIPAHYIAAADQDPIQVIKQHALFHQEVIAVRKEHLVKLREERERRQTVERGLTGEARAAAVRKRLFRQENMRREDKPGK
jgi:hypothetical protein